MAGDSLSVLLITSQKPAGVSRDSTISINIIYATSRVNPKTETNPLFSIGNRNSFPHWFFDEKLLQRKMTNTMAMQEQIELSGLEIMSSLSSSSSSSQLQWNSTNQWSPLLGGRWGRQACVTIERGNENGAGGQTIVVIGGRMQRAGCTNSVIVWYPSTKRWRKGPRLNDKRKSLVAVVCHDKVYVIGGWGGDNNYNNYTTLDTIESIQVSSLLETTETSMMTRQNNSQWTRLQCRLSSPRRQCVAVVVYNHYIVILGGVNGMHHNLSSVDIMDTAPPHNNNNNSNGEPTIVAGPRMNLR